MKTLTRLLSLALPLVCLLAACQQTPDQVMVTVEDEAVVSPVQAVAQPTRDAAKAVLASLTDAQRDKVSRPIQDPLRKNWHFIPRQREGLMLGEMTLEQKTLVHQLMQTALSDSGYLKATDIIWLESVLYEMENRRALRDPGQYALVIFGDPADEMAAWGWRLEGHHLSVNLTYTAEGIGVTPLFFGTNPAVVPIGPLAGKRVLAEEHNLAIRLASSMTGEQRKKMLLAQKPRDVITGPGREASLREPAGIARNELSEEQYALLLQLVSAHGNNIAHDHQWVRVEKMIAEDRVSDQLAMHFAWAGPTDGSKPFYYRISSPDAIVEYSCQDANHVHAVLHDLTDPLQEDLLKKHFEQHEH